MYIYFITKAIYYPSYHYFVVTHALWHMMYGYHKVIAVITGREQCFYD